MLFTDEESRHKFHTSSTLLQVVSQMVESELTQHHLQVEFVDCEQQGNFWVALLVIGSPDFEDSPDQQAGFKSAVEAVNRRFLRADGEETASIEDGLHGLITIRVTDAQDLTTLN